MGRLKIKPHLSVADYLAGERNVDVRHEYVDGQVYALAGASDRHNRITLNIASRLNDHLVDDECEAFMSDMKIRVSPALYYYPDVVVTCDAPGGDAYYRVEPRLIVEVMSPSTERVDRIEKRHAYRRVESLREYVLVAQDAPFVELHRRGADGTWTIEAFSDLAEQLTLASVDLALDLSDVYRNVRFDDAGAT